MNELFIESSSSCLWTTWFIYSPNIKRLYLLTLLGTTIARARAHANVRSLSLSLSLSNIFLHSYTSRLGIPSKQSRKRAWSSQENGLDIIIIIKFYILTKKRSNILFNFFVHCTLMTYWRKFEWLWFVPFFKI